jgi:hypothetical protein
VNGPSRASAPPGVHAPTPAAVPDSAEHPLVPSEEAKPAPRGPDSQQHRAGVGALTFTRLKWTSFGHSCIYVGLLISAFAAGKPEPLTFVLGLTHGVLWILMSIACLVAARLRVVPLRVAVAVAVLGGVGPFFGSFEFIREQRKHPC